MDLSGKVALVTGAGSGIGKASALVMAGAGADMVVNDVDEAKASAVTAAVEEMGQRALTKVADVSDPDAVDGMVDEVVDGDGGLGAIDILVNNAAIIHGRIPVMELDPYLWRDVLNVNLTGAFLLTRAILPGMIDRGYGRIINISSIGGRKGGAGRSAYRVTKSGLISLTESLAAEVYEHGINVNAICPGGTDTEGFRAAFNTTGRAENPKLMDPSEIAEVALFLASDASSAVTGTAIDSFGGSNPLFG